MKNDAVTTDKQKSQRLVDVAYDNNERLLSLVDDIFLVQKLDLDKAETRLGLVNLAEVIERAVAPFWSKAKNEEITLTFSESGTPCFVNGDEKQLERVFEKILSNAFKFSKRGGAIKVALLASDTGPEVRIEDEGVGISHGSQEKVFGLFSQMDSSDTRSQGGSGLGMYISKKVLKHHNATIHYESEPGVGTTFIVNFPKQILQ
jgi:signal transduction histidine kinase